MLNLLVSKSIKFLLERSSIFNSGLNVSELNLDKIDNMLKLIYKLFLYSIIGFLAGLTSKFLHIKEK